MWKNKNWLVESKGLPHTPPKPFLPEVLLITDFPLNPFQLSVFPVQS